MFNLSEVSRRECVTISYFQKNYINNTSNIEDRIEEIIARDTIADLIHSKSISDKNFSIPQNNLKRTNPYGNYEENQTPHKKTLITLPSKRTLVLPQLPAPTKQQIIIEKKIFILDQLPLHMQQQLSVRNQRLILDQRLIAMRQQIHVQYQQLQNL